MRHNKWKDRKWVTGPLRKPLVPGEKAAAKSLKRSGFETYLPVTSVSDRIAPLFPCYLFVRVVERWTPIATTLGVVRVLRDGDGPARLPERVLDDLRAREVNGVVRLPSLRIGQTVRILRGSLRGTLAVYDGMSGRDRERVLLDFLGGKVRASIRLGDAVAH